jgi:hypothetical protein
MPRLSFMAGLAAVAVVSIGPQTMAIAQSSLPRLELSSPDLLSDLGLRSSSRDLGETAGQEPELVAGSQAFDLVPGLNSSAPGLNFQVPSLKSGFAEATIALASDLHLRFGATAEQARTPDFQPLSGLDRLELSRVAQDTGVRSGLTGVDWSFASWGSLGLSVSQTQLGYAALGGPLMLQSSGANATTVAISARLGLGDGWVTSISYDQGRSQLDLRSNGFIAKNDSSGYGIAVAKYGLFGADSLGLAMIRPVVPTAELAPQSGYSGLLGNAESLSDQKPETDLELGYETSFNGNITLEANAGYQMNVAGQTGANAVSVLSRAKINF